MAEAITFKRISTGSYPQQGWRDRALLSIPPSLLSAGAADDLQRVTRLAYGQVAEAGMSEHVGHLSFPSRSEMPGRRPYSKWLAAQIDTEVCSTVMCFNVGPQRPSSVAYEDAPRV